MNYIIETYKYIQNFFAYGGKIYNFLIYTHYKYVLIAIVAIFITLLSFAFKLQIDASSDTLVIDGDKDYKYFTKVANKYGDVSDTLVLVYEPKTYMLVLKF